MLRAADYAAIGRLSHAISDHANQVFDQLDKEQKKIAEIMFKRLTDRNQEQNPVRRPSTVRAIAEVAQVPHEAVIEVANYFRAVDYNFLMPEGSVELTSDSFLDISHESIMRQWEVSRIPS